jgi:voltage-gated potassium channel
VIRRKWVVPSLIASGVLVIVAGGAVAAVETDIVTSFPRGIWWSLSLMTTVGFLGAPPTTTPGAILSVALMVGGFFLLALVSAALASLFVREDEKPAETREDEALRSLLSEVTQLKSEVAALRSAVTHDRETRD